MVQSAFMASAFSILFGAIALYLAVQLIERIAVALVIGGAVLSQAGSSSGGDDTRRVSGERPVGLGAEANGLRSARPHCCGQECS